MHSMKPEEETEQYAYPDENNITFSDSVYELGKILYFGSFAVAVLYTTILLIAEPIVIQNSNSFTFVLIIIYGFIPVWALLVNFVLIVVGKATVAIWFDRVFVKLVIMVFPILGFIAERHDHFFGRLRSVAAFMTFFCFLSVFLICYQIYSCTFAQIQNPKYVFKKNDLTQATKIITEQRAAYSQAR